MEKGVTDERKANVKQESSSAPKVQAINDYDVEN